MGQHVKFMQVAHFPLPVWVCRENEKIVTISYLVFAAELCLSMSKVASIALDTVLILREMLA